MSKWRCRARILFELSSRSLVALVVGLLASTAGAVERLGLLEVSDVFLEPSFRYVEKRQGGFSAGNSLLSVRWLRDDAISAVVTVGHRDLIGRPRWFAPSSEAELTLAEAYIQAASPLGTFRFGRVELPFGTEAGRGESRLRLPRSILFRENWVGLRDQGLSYSVENEGFFSEWAVHNGESGPDLDNQIWFTGRWGWKGGEGIYAGFSGATGRTTPESTQDANRTRTSTGAGLDPDRSSKVRIVNVFAEWDARPMGLTLEATGGEIQQVGVVTRIRAARADVNYGLTRRVSVLGRYDLLDPNDRVRGDKRDEVTVGFGFRGLYETSTLYVFGTRSQLENAPKSSHQVLVVWRLTPFAREPR